MDERRQRATRDALTDPDAEARRVAAQLRAGELSVEAVQVAAYLGDPPSRAVLGCPPPDRGLDLVRRFEEVLKSGFRVGPGRVARLDRPAHLEALARDCVELLLVGAGPQPPARRALAAMASGDPAAASAQLAELEATCYEGTGWEGLRQALEAALAVQLAPTRRRRVHALRDAFARCERRGGERSAYPWLARRLSARLLGRALPAPPPASELPLPEPGPRPLRAHYGVLAAFAAFPPAWRAALWTELERVLAGDPSALRPVAGPRGGWSQLPLAPSSRLGRLRLASPPPVAHLLLRDEGAPALELVDVARYPWLRVERVVQDCHAVYSYVFAESGAEELPRHDLSQCRFLAPPHSALPFHTGVSLLQLRGAVESLRETLQDPNPSLPEPLTQDRREAKHADVLPELRERSAALLAQRTEPRDGELVVGRCPRCSAEEELRVIASYRLVVCYSCYFDWW